VTGRTAVPGAAALPPVGSGGSDRPRRGRRRDDARGPRRRMRRMAPADETIDSLVQKGSLGFPSLGVICFG